MLALILAVLVQDPAVHAVDAAPPAVVETRAQETAPAPRPSPGWLGLLPPLVAIALAILTRQVLLPLFIGAWVGMFVAGGFTWHAPVTSAIHVVDRLVLGALLSPGMLMVVCFLFLLGGMVGVMSSSGGTKGVADKLGRGITSPRQVMLATWAMGVILFIKDYAAALLIGGSMRPLADRLRLSREKLAYLIDSTVAPMAAIGLFSTWAVLELGATGVKREELFGLFLQLVPYGFYALFAVLLSALVAATGRDFGPMLSAESRAASSGLPVRIGGRPLADREVTEIEEYEDMRERWQNVAVPLLVLVVSTVVMLYVDGRRAPSRPPHQSGIGQVLGYARADQMALWGILAGTFVAMAMAVVRKHLEFRQAVAAWVRGARAMFLPAVVLLLAFGMAQLGRTLGTADWLWNAMRTASLSSWTPAVVFLAAAVSGAAMGSSWAALAVLLPAIYPVVSGGEDPQKFAALAAALSGVVFGRHVSPVSDFSLVSSIGAASDPIDHVKTQAPYAGLCGVAALACGFLPAGHGVSPWLSILVGGGVVAGVFFALSKPRSERWTGWAAPAPPPSISAPTEIPLPEEQTMS